MRTTFLVIAAAAALSSIAGWACSLPIGGCTMVGCGTAASVTIQGFSLAFEGNMPVTVRGCVDDTCDEFEIEAVPGEGIQCAQGACSIENGELHLDFGFDMPESNSVSVRITDANNMVLFEESQKALFQESTPNGPSCGPTCYHAETTFDASP